MGLLYQFDVADVDFRRDGLREDVDRDDEARLVLQAHEVAFGSFERPTADLHPSAFAQEGMGKAPDIGAQNGLYGLNFMVVDRLISASLPHNPDDTRGLQEVKPGVVMLSEPDEQVARE